MKLVSASVGVGLGGLGVPNWAMNSKASEEMLFYDCRVRTGNPTKFVFLQLINICAG